MALKFSYITPSQLISLRKTAKVAIIDVRDEERIYEAHIAGSLHYASESFSERIENLAGAIQGNGVVVFHCALSQGSMERRIIPQVYSRRVTQQNDDPNIEVRGPSCAKTFTDYLSKMNENTEIKEVMVLERGFNGWQASGRPVCNCTDIPCKSEIA